MLSEEKIISDLEKAMANLGKKITELERLGKPTTKQMWGVTLLSAYVIFLNTPNNADCDGRKKVIDKALKDINHVQQLS